MCLGRNYFEKKLELVEQNGLRAELLSEVVCIRDEFDGALRPVWDSQTSLEAMRVGPQAPLPSNPEQLRRTLNIVGSARYFVGSVHIAGPYLAEMGMHVWAEYCDFLLGSYVLGLLSSGLCGAVSADNWTVVLNYEQEIRRDMVNRMLSGTPLVHALRDARRIRWLKTDTLLRHFRPVPLDCIEKVMAPSAKERELTRKERRGRMVRAKERGSTRAS